MAGIYWLGTDDKGRDILSRLIFGSRLVLFWSTFATVVAYAVGMLMGVAAGYRGGWWDEILSFIGNVFLAFPQMVLYIVILSQFGPELPLGSACQCTASARLGEGPDHRAGRHVRHRAAGRAHRARPRARSQDARLYRRRRSARRKAASTSCWSNCCPMPAGR